MKNSLIGAWIFYAKLVLPAIFKRLIEKAHFQLKIKPQILLIEPKYIISLNRKSVFSNGEMMQQRNIVFQLILRE